MARILVIDDEDRVRRFLRDALRTLGHQVDLASDGDAGLRLFRDLPADVVLVDMFMPEHDGLSTLLALLADDPSVKVIAMSGGGSDRRFDPLDDARSLGAVCTLRKPFKLPDLFAVVDEVIAA